MKRLDMRENRAPGFLITFCGLDGCGKTTMMERLTNDLKKDFDVFTTKQPTSNVRRSDIFRTYMDCPNHDAFDYRSLSLLAASDRVQHVSKVIAPALESGRIVLSDRYFYSCLANLRARGFKTDKSLTATPQEPNITMLTVILPRSLITRALKLSSPTPIP